MKSRYRNLLAELARCDIGVDDVAKTLHCSRQNVYSKVRGDTEFALGDVTAIQGLINSRGHDYTIDYLFSQDD